MVNPYYYYFYLFYLLLNPIAKDKTRLPFAIASFMGLILMIHAGIFIIVIKTYFGIYILPKMNKLLFGGLFTVLYFSVNSYLFERDSKFVKIMDEIEFAPTYKKVNSAIIIVIYFLAPLIIKLIFT